MRHRKKGGKLNRTAAHRKALMRNLMDSLIINSRMETTLAKAKELKRFADHFFSRIRKSDLPAKKRAIKVLRTKDAFKKLFEDDFIDFLNSREGGYVRVIRTGNRFGDAAPLAIIELTGKYEPNANPKAATKKESKPAPKKEQVKPEAPKEKKEEKVEKPEAIKAEKPEEKKVEEKKTADKKPEDKKEETSVTEEKKESDPAEEKTNSEDAEKKE